jgi:hypothetical protein
MSDLICRLRDGDIYSRGSSWLEEDHWELVRLVKEAADALEAAQAQVEQEHNNFLGMLEQRNQLAGFIETHGLDASEALLSAPPVILDE